MIKSLEFSDYIISHIIILQYPNNANLGCNVYIYIYYNALYGSRNLKDYGKLANSQIHPYIQRQGLNILTFKDSCVDSFNAFEYYKT